jgi:Flp pilus assembly protein TadD
LSEAEARVKELRATAERRTNELALREQELRTRRDSITGSLSSLSGDQPAVAAPSGSSMAATISPEAAEARRREMEAMRQESTATPVAPVWFPPAAPPATSASGARQLSEESIVRASGSIPAVAETGPRELDLGAAAATQSATLSGLADHEEVFFTGAHAAIEEHHELDEMYGSNEKEPSAVRWTWIILGILVLVVIAAVLNVGNEPEPAPAPPPAPAAAQAAPAAPTAEELAKKAAAEAFDKAKIAGNDVGIAIANSATDLAEAWASSKTKELPSVAKSAPKKEISAPKSTAAPAPAIVAPVAKGSGDKCATSFAAKKYKDAVANCNAAIEADPQNSDALTYLGQAYYEMGEASSATGPLERALRINRRNTNALLTLGAARQESGNNAGAREAYERYLELNPNSRRAGEIRTILQGL